MSKQRKALLIALDALNRNDYLGWQANIPVMQLIREALAEPEQEPEISKYKKRIAELEELRVLAARNHDTIVDAIHNIYREKLARKPLTESAIRNLAADYYEGYGFKALEFARAIEKKIRGEE